MCMQKIVIIIIFFFLTFTSKITLANEFVMLKNDKVNVRYGPSFEYPIKFVYLKKYLPVKIIDKKENFRKTNPRK